MGITIKSETQDNTRKTGIVSKRWEKI